MRAMTCGKNSKVFFNPHGAAEFLRILGGVRGKYASKFRLCFCAEYRNEIFPIAAHSRRYF
jgi:hypothetical protein